MKDRFEAIKEIEVSSFFEESDPGWSEMDVLIANTLETDGAFVATGLPDGGHLEEAISGSAPLSMYVPRSIFHENGHF